MHCSGQKKSAYLYTAATANMNLSESKATNASMDNHCLVSFFASGLWRRLLMSLQVHIRDGVQKNEEIFLPLLGGGGGGLDCH